MSGGFILNTRRRIKGHYLEPVPNGPNANTGAGFTARRPPTKTVLDRSGRANSAFIKRLGSWFSCRSTPRAGWLHLGTDEMKFTAIEQLPLDGLACLHADGGG